MLLETIPQSACRLTPLHKGAFAPSCCIKEMPAQLPSELVQAFLYRAFFRNSFLF